MTSKQFSEYAERNSHPILKVLQNEFLSSGRVLEIGSGTGQHAVRFAAKLRHLVWQTSDLIENHESINAWLSDSGLSNVLPALTINVLDADIATHSFDAVYSANTAHIMGFAAVERMFELVGTALAGGGTFCLYGPFRQNGEFNTASNASFHQNLQSRNPEMGIRDIEDLDGFGRSHELHRVRLYAMPANNHLAVWKKGAT
jgi:cyclopropane fatty-acyl-phospholipid synthase-like methyltransferase